MREIRREEREGVREKGMRKEECVVEKGKREQEGEEREKKDPASFGKPSRQT